MNEDINLGIYVFPTPYVFNFEVKNHKQIKQQLLPIILKAAEENKDNPSYSINPSPLITNRNDMSNQLYNQELYDSIVWQPIDSFFRIIKSPDSPIDLIGDNPLNSTIDSVWWNVFQPEAYTELHHRGQGLISGIYILELNEDNTTSFYTPDHHQYGLNAERTHHKLDYVSEGTVLLFPSSLLHYSSPCSKRMVTISFNVETTFDESPYQF